MREYTGISTCWEVKEAGIRAEVVLCSNKVITKASVDPIFTSVIIHRVTGIRARGSGFFIYTCTAQLLNIAAPRKRVCVTLGNLSRETVLQRDSPKSLCRLQHI